MSPGGWRQRDREMLEDALEHGALGTVVTPAARARCAWPAPCTSEGEVGPNVPLFANESSACCLKDGVTY